MSQDAAVVVDTVEVMAVVTVDTEVDAGEDEDRSTIRRYIDSEYLSYLFSFFRLYQLSSSRQIVQ